jgi:hypothetical protein
MDPIKMNRAIIAVSVAAALGLSACSSTKPAASGPTGLAQPRDAQVAVKDTKIITEFKDEGIKLHFNMLGELDRIEVFGVAPAWKGNSDVIAELDAMDKLVKFVHGQTVSTERRTKIVARAIDRARDNTLNRFKTNDQALNFTATELENDSAPLPNLSGDEKSQNNTSRRVADRVENTLTETVTSLTASGRLTGVRKIRDRVLDDGRTYVAVFQWSDKDQTASEFIRNRMK